MLTNKTAYESSSKVCLSWGREKHIMHSTYLHHSSTIALKQATWQRHLLSPSSLTIFSQFQCSLTHKKVLCVQKNKFYSHHYCIIMANDLQMCNKSLHPFGGDKWKANLCGLGQCFVVVVTVMAFPNVPEIKSFVTNVPNLYIYIILGFYKLSFLSSSSYQFQIYQKHPNSHQWEPIIASLWSYVAPINGRKPMDKWGYAPWKFTVRHLKK